MDIWEGLLKKINELRDEWELIFDGPQDRSSIDELATALQISLPEPYKEFLSRLGGGGTPGNWISGIYNNDPLRDQVGFAFRDTLVVRKKFNLPDNRIVIKYDPDVFEVVCLDIDSASAGYGDVVVFDVLTKEETVVNNDFLNFFREYIDEVDEDL